MVERKKQKQKEIDTLEKLQKGKDVPAKGKKDDHESKIGKSS